VGVEGLGQESIIFIVAMLLKNISLTTLARRQAQSSFHYDCLVYRLRLSRPSTSNKQNHPTLIVLGSFVRGGRLRTLLELFNTIVLNNESLEKWNIEMRKFINVKRIKASLDIKL